MTVLSTLEQYGALPWRKDRHGNLRVLLVTSRGRGRWIVPKGWPMKDRAPYLAAALEAFEEAGVVGEVVPQPVGKYTTNSQGDDGELLGRHITLYALKVVGTLTNWPERAQRKRRWFGLEEAAELVADPGLSEVLRELAEAPHLLTGADSRRREPTRSEIFVAAPAG